MEKEKFIPTFIQAILFLAKGFTDAFAHESWHYKDLRIAGYDPKKIYKGLHNLELRKIVRQNADGKYRFTPRGFLWLKSKVHTNFREKYKKWDRKWRVVFFDIPEDMARQRIAFRRKLKYLGFYPLQKSVFVFPYPCEEEVGDLAKPLGIQDYIDLITADSLGGREDELIRNFVL